MLTAGSAVAVILGLWLTASAWGDQPPGAVDSIAHLIRAECAIDQLISQGQIDGWGPSFMLGYETFLFSGPGATWAVAIFTAVVFAALEVSRAPSVVVFVVLAVVLLISMVLSPPPGDPDRERAASPPLGQRLSELGTARSCFEPASLSWWWQALSTGWHGFTAVSRWWSR